MVNTEEQEIWKTYPKIPFIQASNLGRVRTKDRYVRGKNRSKRLIKGRVLKQYSNNKGYLYVTFSVNDKPVHLFVHRIVATCFISNQNGYPEVNHIDCDPTNNRLENLEWCTSQYNSAYRDKLGHTAKHNAPKKSVIVINLDTSEVFWFESQHEAGRKLSVYQTNITRVVKGKLNKTGGYWFCDADKTAVEKTRAKFGDEVANKVEKLMNEHRN